MSSIDDLRRKIEALGRRALPPSDAAEMEAIRRRVQQQRAQLPPSPAQPIVFQRHVPATPLKPLFPRLSAANPVKLEEAVPGSEILTANGSFYLVSTRPKTLDGRFERLHGSYRALLARQDSGFYRRLARQGPISALSPEHILFVDLETTGLGSSPLFLIGILCWEESGLIVRQYLARDYAEERAVICAFLDYAAGRKLLVSFNGKSFDVPYLRMRSVANAVPFTIELPHLDLLHECRRVWRGKLPDCKLQTLERHICGRTRYGDIPGAMIPDAYHAFVRTGNAAQVATILEHNRMDLITLADLIVRMPEP